MASVTTIELNTEYKQAHRFPGWIALSVFSAVCLAAVQSGLNKSNRATNDKWVLTVTIISMSVSFLAVVAYLIGRSMFVGQMPEVIMVRTYVRLFACLFLLLSYCTSCGVC